MRFFITGGAGFIGSNLCDYFINKKNHVMVFDNFSTGKDFFLKEASKSNLLSVVRGDICNLGEIQPAMMNFKPDWIIHLAANADVRRGVDNPRKDLDNNTIGTWNVLEAARISACNKILFSSTGSVYGEPSIYPTPEDAPFPEQTSLYAASKLAGEGILSAYCHGFGMTGIVMRFVSILGPRYSHGHVFDFLQQLIAHPDELNVLGDGNQTKSYLHVSDLMHGIFSLINLHNNTSPNFSVYNIGHDSTLAVRESIKIITECVKLTPKINFSGGERGWIGDSPKILLSIKKLKGIGWNYNHSLKESIIDTVSYLMKNQFLLTK